MRIAIFTSKCTKIFRSSCFNRISSPSYNVTCINGGLPDLFLMLALVVVPIRSSRVWETPKGGELMGVDMLLLDEKLPDAEVCAFIVLKLIIFGKFRYGQSSGKPSEQNTYADIEAAYKCLEENYGAKQENIILYQSIGSGPTVDLAARLLRSAGDLY
ncbi:BnaCnng24740D [Brassica napus]|uniref:BnaCnng24740D protein n=1 Tax=Brassica napus TaxID=3708 RepID=A0A078ITE0_BRANA|nr:BnaCnng24740D [Brassica napus]